MNDFWVHRDGSSSGLALGRTLASAREAVHTQRCWGVFICSRFGGPLRCKADIRQGEARAREPYSRMVHNSGAFQVKWSTPKFFTTSIKGHFHSKFAVMFWDTCSKILPGPFERFLGRLKIHTDWWQVSGSIPHHWERPQLLLLPGVDPQGNLDSPFHSLCLCNTGSHKRQSFSWTQPAKGAQLDGGATAPFLMFDCYLTPPPLPPSKEANKAALGKRVR